MAGPLLSTKLHIPPLRPHLVQRSGLISKLDDGLRRQRPLTLISAPAGYGKTTVVLQWQQAHSTATDQTCAFSWLALDAGDNDPARFLAYLVAALQRVDASIG